MRWLSDESVNLWELLGDCEMTMSWSRWLWEECEMIGTEILLKSLWDIYKVSLTVIWQWDDCNITVRWLWDDYKITLRWM